MKPFIIPANINEILAEDGIWEDESLEPILVRVIEAELTGREVISFEMEFPAEEALGEISSDLKRKEIELDGYEWESLIIEYIKKTNPKLAAAVHGDSEDETCVLWTKSKEEFMELKRFLFEIIDTPDDFVKLIKK